VERVVISNLRLAVVLICAFLLVIRAADAAETRADAKGVLDPSLPYQAERSNPVTYEVEFVVTVTAPYHTKRLRVWLPLPPSDAAQEVSGRELVTFPLAVKPEIGKEPVFGNEFAYFEFDHPEGAQIIRHKFRIKVWELNWELDPARVPRESVFPRAFDRYLRGDETVVLDDSLAARLREIVPRRQGPAQDLATVMTWLNQRMKYDHSAASLKASSRHALETLGGHCSDYHGLCAAFGRALGFPTRVTYGINPFPKSSPSHCKFEAFLPPYGWVSFDVSETQRLVEAIGKSSDLPDAEKQMLIAAATNRLRAGFRDNTWYLQTRGTDYDLAPPANRRVPVVRTIYAEADGEPLPDPDPADAKKREFGWMTAHQYKADREVTYPFKDWKSLKK
jgi:transglutaminase-like putative cysteine protease